MLLYILALWLTLQAGIITGYLLAMSSNPKPKRPLPRPTIWHNSPRWDYPWPENTTDQAA